MHYSVITKIGDSEENEPFVWLTDARVYFEDLIKNAKNFDVGYSVFLIDNATNQILYSQDSFINSFPVEYQEIKQITTSTKEMIYNLHDLMELRNLTLTDVSGKCGISVPNLCKFFKADNNPTLRNFVRVSNAINLL